VFFGFYVKLRMVRIVARLTGFLVNLTKSGVEHVKSHPVALFCASDGNQSLIAIVLWLIDLDDTTTHLSDLINLLATLSNDSSDHVIRDIYLLGQGGTRHAAMDRLCLRATVWLWACVRSTMGWYMGCSGTIRSGLGSIVNWHGWVRMSGMRIRLGVRRWRHMRSGIMSSAIVFSVTVITAGRLWAVRDNLHTARNDAGRTTASSSVCRGCWTAESLIKLL
jgi:hypothetical protein